MENKKKSKNDLNIAKNYRQSIIAGILIGFGVIINTITSPAILGATLFSFGLLAVIQLQIPLYTGRIGFVINRDMQPYLMIFLGNCFGIFLVTIFYAGANKDFALMLQQVAVLKFSKTYLAMALYGCLCGFLIHIAVKCKVPIITMGAIIIFILIGSEHCIADVPYMLINYSWESFLKWLLVILGNSLGAIFAEGMLKNE